MCKRHTFVSVIVVSTQVNRILLKIARLMQTYLANSVCTETWAFLRNCIFAAVLFQLQYVNDFNADDDDDDADVDMMAV